VTLTPHVAACTASVESRLVGRLPPPRWWLWPLLGPLQPGLIIETRGPRPLQRHVLACVLAAVDNDDGFTLRVSAASIGVVIEQALAKRSGVWAEQLALGIVPPGSWGRLADGAAALARRAVTVEVDDTIDGAVIQSGAVSWCLGRSPGAHIELKVSLVAGAVTLEALDGRCSPPMLRRAVIVAGRLEPDAETRSFVDEMEALIELNDTEPEGFHDVDEQP